MKWLDSVGVTAIVACVFVTGCATSHDPGKLSQPKVVTCINLPTAMSFKEQRGLSNTVWETRLERGPYISEKEDDEGTYYRAPPGGVFEGRPDSMDKPPGMLTHVTRDGGIWIARDAKVPPRVYSYFSTSEAAKQVPPESANCSSLVVLRDPATSRIDVVAFATEGALGGALGGAEGRAMVPGSTMTSGQAITGGAVGGAIGMTIVAAIINMDVGKLFFHPPVKDVGFIAKLREMAAQPVALRESPAQAKK